ELDRVGERITTGAATVCRVPSRLPSFYRPQGSESAPLWLRQLHPRPLPGREAGQRLKLPRLQRDPMPSVFALRFQPDRAAVKLDIDAVADVDFIHHPPPFRTSKCPPGRSAWRAP